MTDISATGDRIATIDAVRGMAVMGILLMNIVALGMPGHAYVDPTFFGMTGTADWIAWTINYIVSDGKFRALFTMLFGASMVIIAGRACTDGWGPARIHYARMFWLFVIGMIHAWFFWYGDILVQYAVGGALGFLIWRWPPRALWFLFAAMLVLQTAGSVGQYAALAPVRAAAQVPSASAHAVAAWDHEKAADLPTQTEAAAEIIGYRGDFRTVFATRAQTTIFFQTVVTPLTMPEIFAFMALGILMLRNGFFGGSWACRSYALVIASGYLVAVPLMAVLANMLRAAAFDPATQALCDTISLLLRPFIALAHAAVVILVAKSGRVPSALARLESVGRMALSNYLGTTVLATTFFYGYGFSWFGRLGRAELYWVVAVIWALMLLSSKPWLGRFRYGPAEWLWRSLVRWQRQPMRL